MAVRLPFKLTVVYICILMVVGVESQKSEKQLESNQPCKADKDCIENSICIGNTVENSGLCTCKKDFIPKKNLTYYECLPELRNITDRCKEDVQCQVAFTNYAECRNDKCVCKQGSHFYGNRCYETVKLGNICTFQQSCLLKNGSIGGCVDGHCSCGLLQHAVSDSSGESCERDVEIGEPCERDQQCVVENTRCFGTCRCRPGYTTSSSQTVCLKEALNFLDPCLEDSQCEVISLNAACDQLQCKCRIRFHQANNSCFRDVKLNGTCTSTPECLMTPGHEDVECKEGKCTCTFKYSEDGKRCVNGASFGTAGQGLVIAMAFWVVFKGIQCNLY